jgi:cytochrome c556
MKKLDLKKIKAEKAAKTKQQPEGKLVLELPGHNDALVAVTKSIDDLSEFLNGKEDYDFDKLKSQLEQIDKHLDLSQYFSALEKALEANKPKDSVKASITNFAELIDAVKANKPIETKIDLKNLEKAIVQVQQAIEKNSEPSDQGAENYQPVRRVVKVGNRFIFDDNMTSGGSGGGGGVPTIDVDGSTVVPVTNPDGTDIGSGSSPAQYIEDTAHVAATDEGNLAYAVRRDADTSAVTTDGDIEALHTNQYGRLKVSTQPAAITATTGNITAIGNTVAADVARAGNVTVSLTGTFATFNGTFEASIDGGTTYFAVLAVRSNANTAELTTGSLSASPAYMWKVSVASYTNFRVRATAIGSGTAVITILPGSLTTEVAPAVQTHAVTGSGNFAVTMAAGATASPAKARDGVAGVSDTGIPPLLVRRDTPTAVTPIAGDYEFAQLNANGEQWVREYLATTPTVTSVDDSATSVTLLSSSTTRKGFRLFNDSDVVAYVKYGATATVTDYSIKLFPQSSHYEDNYNGNVDCIWASNSTGAMKVTSLA